MWLNIKSNVTRVAIAFTALSLTACGGGGGTSLTQAKAPSITLSATSQNMPVQNNGYLYPDQTGLYNSRLIATVRDNQGNPVAAGGSVTFTVQGGQTNIGSLFESDFKTTVTVTNPDGTTSTHPAAFWGLPVDISGSMAQCIFQAGTKTGQVIVAATYTDPNTKQSVQASLPIQVGAATNTGLPSSLVAQVNNLPIYVTGQSKNSQATIDAFLYDPANQPVGSNGANNVQATIVGNNLGGSYLIGSGGQSGSTVVTQSQGSSGLAQLTLISGTNSGTLTIQLTADGADNNVDNGIQKPITKTVTVAISDGRVASLSFGGPYINAIKNNPASIPLNTTGATPDNLDQGTYSRAISVVAQDANGNPVQGTQINFGLIDSPITNYPSTSGTFKIQGVQGNPTEGGNRFDENDGINLVAEGVGALDRLVLLPSEQGTEREMRVSRLISTIVPGTTSAVNTINNFPKPTVQGFVNAYNIPWIIGRPQYGNITATATTDNNGVATVLMTYPVSRLGQPAILTAQADNGVSSVIPTRYVGVAGGTLTSSITSVPSGASATNTQVTLCAQDANKVPLPNLVIGAGLSNGVTTNPSAIMTDSTGCATFTLTVPPTISVNNSTTPPTVTTLITTPFDIPFSSGSGANENIKITVQSPPQ